MTSSLFAAVEMAPRDPILGLNEAFNADSRTTKVNLGVGVYFTDEGKIPLLGAVKAAEKARLEAAPARGYQPIEGLAAYNKAVGELLFGKDSALLAEGKTITIEALGGTGALKVGADFLKRLNPASKVYISDPSWENHRALFESAGFVVENYPYYDATTRGVNFAGMKACLGALPAGSVIVLHACCHNPTGADLSDEQWAEIVSISKERGLVPFLDMAYQGFAEGIDADAVAVRAFSASGLQFFISSSFSKSFSLYGERVGALTIVAASKEEAGRVLSQVKRVVRTNYSNPPTHGGAIVAAVLASAELRKQWEDELAGMRLRIREMRKALVEQLAAAGVAQDFSFVLKQRGMFSYTGLTAAQVERLKAEFRVYAVSTGRVCIAALNSKNIDYVAKAIATVLK
ncbi:MAG: aromatic amino acid aminotransferase [Candidatus Dactylopiibacterium carminicum]|uniref:Aminotransferase n=1 Tax=Candidatus Dactylopiibacterium carminicum TaxID=857335 RepID=A0A272ES53_9RHOO|nr:amino acid aminotransferase [Candidatus Dactylopiibacterium carminicum]KAF7598997.1 aspartate/tyrosine/aromatic aminotransferase [Candidatus Dactylopiibacterium carminicum]PAS92937.1 MAG: aromatic amino acid aminotransferase [Candidatus Dactylopiibacterium carminicum]PAS96588.1 MAG: aromatic amino acid aminotransferase [Candidatus Dactylopiibacterium carminicum]PAS99008.1 MAG: aromatic amino acid aminotransferase [Candidatus Dactylopiibacterium carminicum]